MSPVSQVGLVLGYSGKIPVSVICYTVSYVVVTQTLLCMRVCVDDVMYV